MPTNSPLFGGKLQHAHLNPHVKGSISWKFSNDGVYSAKSAYKARSLPPTFSTLPSQVWKHWAPTRMQAFHVVVIKNRICTTDRLERRGWENCGRRKRFDSLQGKIVKIVVASVLALLLLMAAAVSLARYIGRESFPNVHVATHLSTTCVLAWLAATALTQGQMCQFFADSLLRLSCLCYMGAFTNGTGFYGTGRL